MRNSPDSFSDSAALRSWEPAKRLLPCFNWSALCKSVGALLDGRLQAIEDHEVRQELACYRQNLVRLRDELARMQESAVGCRVRLDSRLKHLHAAQAWCAASRGIS